MTILLDLANKTPYCLNVLDTSARGKSLRAAPRTSFSEYPHFVGGTPTNPEQIAAKRMALAIALVEEGGLDVIHRNMTVAHRTHEVEKVKRSEDGIVVDPMTLPPDVQRTAAMKLRRSWVEKNLTPRNL